MPIFTPHQDAALRAASAWLKAARGRPSIFRLFGYAGTGKTTLAKHLAESIDGKVLFADVTFLGHEAQQANAFLLLLFEQFLDLLRGQQSVFDEGVGDAFTKRF